jgi:hypothetical protein
MKFIEEHNKLLKVKFFKQGSNQWRLLPMEKRDGSKIRRGEITFRGSDEKLKLLLRRLRARDAATDPPSSKNRTYQQMIDTAKDRSDPYIWVYLTNWNNYREDNKITIAERQDDVFLEVNRLLDIIATNKLKDKRWISNEVNLLDRYESIGDIVELEDKIKEYRIILKNYGIKERKDMRKVKESFRVGDKVLVPGWDPNKGAFDDYDNSSMARVIDVNKDRVRIKYLDDGEVTSVEVDQLRKFEKVKEQREDLTFYSISLDELIDKAGSLRGIRAKVKDSDEAYEYLMDIQSKLIKDLSKDFDEIEEVDPTDILDWADNHFEAPSYIRKLLRKNPSFMKTIKKYYDEWEKSNFRPTVGYKFGKEFADAYYKEFKEVPFDPAQFALYVLEDYGNGTLKEGIYKDTMYGTDVDIFLQRRIDRMDLDTLAGALADEFKIEYESALEIVNDYWNSRKGMREEVEKFDMQGKDSTKVQKIIKDLKDKGYKTKYNKENKELEVECDSGDLKKVNKIVMESKENYFTKSSKVNNAILEKKERKKMKKDEKEKIIEIKKDVKVGNIILEKGDKIKVLEARDAVISVRPCKNFRVDTEQCRSGCNRLGLKPGDMCPYEPHADSSLGEEPQSNCPCYE